MIFQKLWDHDLAWSFRRSPVTIVAGILTLVCVGGALLAPWISPQDPFNMAALNLNEASVGTLLARAKRAFRDAYGAYGDDADAS